MQILSGSGAEIVLILALILILLGSRKLPALAKGLSHGLFEFRKAIDNESAEAGRSLGGIYGKQATEALTPDNQVAELYDPAVLQNDLHPHKGGSALPGLLLKFFMRLRGVLRFSRASS